MELEELVYEPVQPNFYNYYAKNLLVNNIDKFLINEKFSKIKVLAYQVNNDGVYPFLQFLLVKYLFSEVLTTPFITLNSIVNTEDVLIMTRQLVVELISICDTNIVFDGFYEYSGEIYVFVDLTQIKPVIHDTYSDSIVRFALIDEILNQKNVCNINVDRNIIDFFNSNYQYCILKDRKNESYEVPIVGYVGKPESKLNFTYIFGETKQDNTAILGPYYYFSDFTNSAKTSANNNGGSKCGVVRFAVFVNKCKYIENYPNDIIDESETKKMRLNDESLEVNYERLTMRISDYDGKWVQNYDSCYLGHIELDNGEYLKNTPVIVVKEYNQQIPLSYHYIKINPENCEHMIV